MQQTARIFTTAMVLSVLVISGVACTPNRDLMEMEQWDLVLISDSSGWDVADEFAIEIEQDLGIDVVVHDFATSEFSAKEALQALRGENPRPGDRKLDNWPEIIKNAEVIVFYANPINTATGEWDCMVFDTPPVDCSPETFDGYVETLDQIYKEIFRLRNGAPTIVRAFDAYMPWIEMWNRWGLETECGVCWKNYNAAIHHAAELNNVPVANAYDAFNGSEHNEDPVEKGLIRSDGTHTSETGVNLMVQLLKELGYEPVIIGEK